MKCALCVLLALLPLIGSAGSMVPPYFEYRAEFHANDAGDAVDTVRAIAAKWDLRVVEMPSSATGGEEAIFVALYLDGDVVLHVTNIAVTNILRVTAYDWGEMPRDDLSKLLTEVLERFEDQFHIKFEKTIESTSFREAVDHVSGLEDGDAAVFFEYQQI